jgi:sulfatase modifying factor 1
MDGRAMVARFVLTLAVGALGLPPTARAGTPEQGRSARTASPAERALGGGLVTLRTPGSTMIRVAAGSFVMGSSPAELALAIGSCAPEALGYLCNEQSFTSELPRHSARLGSFWLDRTEVTAADYDRCAATGVCRPRRLDGGARRFARSELPATLVRAEDAESYCRSRGARLPSEAELERAARGTTGRSYPWGTNYDTRLANHGRLGLDASDWTDGFAELAPVGSFPEGRTPDGFLDLAGNAAEWTRDAFTPRHDLPVDGAWGGARVVRGGHFLSSAAFLRSAVRVPLAPDLALPTVGFRCARSADGRP